jgi:hypothetical protein
MRHRLRRRHRRLVGDGVHEEDLRTVLALDVFALQIVGKVVTLNAIRARDLNGMVFDPATVQGRLDLSCPVCSESLPARVQRLEKAILTTGLVRWKVVCLSVAQEVVESVDSTVRH